MLVVHDKQMEIFERRLFEATQRRIERAIAAIFPEIADERPSDGVDGGAAERASRIKSVVERGIENAVGVDIVDGPDFAAFIALGLALHLAPPGPSANWIHAWLRRPDTPGQTKLRMIESRLGKLAKQEPALAAIAKRVSLAREKMAP